MNRSHINYAKDELRNHRYVLNQCHKLEGEILGLETELAGVRSTSAPTVPGHTSDELKSYRRSDLLDKLQQKQKDHAVMRHRASSVTSFLDALTSKEREIVTRVYIKRDHIEDVAVDMFRSVRQFKRDIDKILRKF